MDEVRKDEGGSGIERRSGKVGGVQVTSRMRDVESYWRSGRYSDDGI